MGVLYKFTLKTLLKNRMRTIVTVIGIALSMALLTAVIEGGYSGMQYLVRGEEYLTGRFYGYFFGMDLEQARSVPEMEYVTETAMMTDVGWAKIGSTNEYKPYLLVVSVSDNIEELVAIHMVEGRMPENDTEIVLPGHLASNGGVEYRVGDILTLQLGKRIAGGQVIHASDNLPFSYENHEEIMDTSEKSYTVVGICERLATDIEYLTCPGYTAFTKGATNVETSVKLSREADEISTGTGSTNGKNAESSSEAGTAGDATTTDAISVDARPAYAAPTDAAATDTAPAYAAPTDAAATDTAPTDAATTNAALVNVTSVNTAPTDAGEDSVRVFFRLISANKLEKFERALDGKNYNIRFNGHLLAYLGSIRDSGIRQVFYGLVTILVLLVVFGSISLIYNSFSISVSERTRQYGILKSAGATSVQIRRTVFMEALTLSAVSIPVGLVVGCFGIGLTLYLLGDAFSMLFEDVASVKIQLVINPAALGIASLCCLITVLISAFIPARRAIKVSPIMSIRENMDVRIRHRAVKTSKLTQYLFGFEGMMAAKNFKRNRKRYRATVISLFLSIVLFVSASSFSSYLKDSAGGFSSSDVDADVRLSFNDNPSMQEMEDRFQMASEITGVDDYSLSVAVSGFQVHIDRKLLSDKYLNNPYEDFSEDYYPDTVPVYMPVIFIDDAHFEAYAMANGISAEELAAQGEARGILYNSIKGLYYTQDGRKTYNYNVLKPEVLPVDIEAAVHKTIAGYDIVSYGEGGDGLGSDYAGKVVYYPLDYLDELYKQGIPVSKADTEKAIILSAEEAKQEVEFPVGLLSDRLPLTAHEKGTPALFYPISAIEELLPEELRTSLIAEEAFDGSVAIRARKHAEVTAKLEGELRSRGIYKDNYVEDIAQYNESIRMAILVINVFSYGFIILISLIAVANVFNTISTNILLRRREFAMLKSVGLSESGFRKMLNYECLIYGFKGLLYGLPAAVAVTYAIYRVTEISFDVAFYIPWQNLVVAIGSVFVVVFATMIYARKKLSQDNPIDALKMETL